MDGGIGLVESSNPDLRRVSGDAMGRFSGTNPWISQGLVLGIGVSLTLMALLWSVQSDRGIQDMLKDIQEQIIFIHATHFSFARVSTAAIVESL